MIPRAVLRMRSRRARSSAESACSAPWRMAVAVSSSRVLPVATSKAYSACTVEVGGDRRKRSVWPSGGNCRPTGRPLENRRVSAYCRRKSSRGGGELGGGGGGGIPRRGGGALRDILI